MTEEKHRELVARESVGMEPVAVLHDDGYWTMTNNYLASCPAGWRMEVYSAEQLAQVQRESETHANNAAQFADELMRVEADRDELLRMNAQQAATITKMQRDRDEAIKALQDISVTHLGGTSWPGERARLAIASIEGRK